MSALLSLRSPNPNDRFRLTLILSMIAHVFVVLGIGIMHLYHPVNETTPPPFEVTLVENETNKPPKDADYLAQSNQEGDGNTTERIRPSAPLPTPSLAHTPGNADLEQHATTARAPADEPQALAVTQASTHQVLQRHEAPDAPHSASISAAELIQRSEQDARLSADLSDTSKVFTQRLRHKYISASAKEYRYAAYMEPWRRKVERVGALYATQDPKLSGLAGQLTLDVGIDADGRIYSVEVTHSSNIKGLDDAAVRIVKLGAPYAPLPDNIRAETDVLHIIRTWQFLEGGHVETSQ